MRQQLGTLVGRVVRVQCPASGTASCQTAVTDRRAPNQTGFDSCRYANRANPIVGNSTARRGGPLKPVTRPEATDLLRLARELVTPGLIVFVTVAGSL